MCLKNNDIKLGNLDTLFGFCTNHKQKIASHMKKLYFDNFKEFCEHGFLAPMLLNDTEKNTISFVKNYEKEYGLKFNLNEYSNFFIISEEILKNIDIIESSHIYQSMIKLNPDNEETKKQAMDEIYKHSLKKGINIMDPSWIFTNRHKDKTIDYFVNLLDILIFFDIDQEWKGDVEEIICEMFWINEIFKNEQTICKKILSHDVLQYSVKEYYETNAEEIHKKVIHNGFANKHNVYSVVCFKLMDVIRCP